MSTSQEVSVTEEKDQGSRRIDLKRLLRGIPWTPVVILFLFLVFGLFGNFLTPHDPLKTNLSSAKKPPFFQEEGSTKYLLGTDNIGRDILSRIITGAGVSLQVGFVVVVFAGALGALIALLSAYLGGWVDMVLMRITDMFLSMPYLIIAIALAAVLGPSKNNVILIMAVLGWAGYARVLRGEVLRIKKAEFIKLAIVARAGKSRVMFQHIFPNIVNTLVVLATLQLGNRNYHGIYLKLSRAGGAAARTGLGVHGGRRKGDHEHGLVGQHLAGIGYFFGGDEQQSSWGLARLRLDPKFRQIC